MNTRLLLLVGIIAIASIVSANGDGSPSDYERALTLAKRTDKKVWRASFETHWLPDQHQFWYCVTTGPGAFEFVKVDAESGTIQRGPDAAKLGLPVQTIAT